MEDKKRACVVAVISAIAGHRNVSSVYDFYTGQYHLFSTNLSDSQISIYDYTRGGYMQGGLEQVYDYASASYVSLFIVGNSFNGYDYECGFYFNGHISSGNISFYDYEKAQYFNYAAS